MKRLFIAIFACAVLAGLALPGAALAASDVLDQSYQPTSGTGFYLGNNVVGCCGNPFTQVLAQTFTAGLTGNLDNVSLWLSYCDPPGDAIIQITPVDATGVPIASTVLASGSFAAGPTANIGCPSYNPQAAWMTASLTSPAPVRSGTKYALVVNTTAGTGGYSWLGTNSPTLTYAGGPTYTSSVEPPTFSNPNPGLYFAFQTFVVPVAQFAVTLPSSVDSGTAFDFSVKALDAAGNPAPSYAGTIHFRSSDGGASLPADYTFSNNDNGAHTFSATLNNAGTQSISVADIANANLNGSNTILVLTSTSTGTNPTGDTGPNPAATPELDSLFLFATGLGGIGSYGLLRLRTRRRA